MDGRRRVLVCTLCASLILAVSACIGTAEPDPDLPLEADTVAPASPTSAPAAEPPPGLAGG
jgi:hypothetical protein